VPKERGPNAETRRRTRKRLLDAGAAEFLESPSTSPIDRISLVAVARRAGVSRNGLAWHWRTRQEFCRDLVAYLMVSSDIFLEDFATIKREAKRTANLPFFEALANTATVDLGTLSNNSAWRAMEILVVGHSVNDPELLSAAREAYKEVDASTWQLYGEIIERSGRRPRPPFTEESIGAVLQALVEGSGIRQLLDDQMTAPDQLGRQNGGFGAYALTVAALLSIFTCPNNDSDERDVAAVVNSLVASSPPRKRGVK
jgi:AcrR family transcriptional regulator